jgi:hypothetical protein
LFGVPRSGKQERGKAERRREKGKGKRQKAKGGMGDERKAKGRRKGMGDEKEVLRSPLSVFRP